MDLTYFLHLSQTGNFTTTASELFVSQPAISQAVKKLEEELGSTLLIRDRKKNTIHLTKTGEVLRSKAEKILTLIDEIHDEIQEIDSREAHLGIPPIVGGYLLPKYLPFLTQISEKIEIIEAEGSVALLQMLMDGDVSTAIVGFSEPLVDEISKFEYSLLFIDDYSLYVGQNHPLASKKDIQLSDLNDETFISFGKGFVQNHVFSNWLQTNKIRPNNINYINELQTAKAFIQANLGVMLLMDLAVHPSNNFVRLDFNNLPQFYIYLIQLKAVSPTSSQAAVNKTIKEVSQKIIKKPR